MTKSEWQRYHSTINGKEAVISVNLEFFNNKQIDESLVVEYTYAYEHMPNGLPTAEGLRNFIQDSGKVSAMLCSLIPAKYVGYWLCDGKGKIYFYLDDMYEIAINEILINTLKIDPSNLKLQHDPGWDIYFDFLLPTAVEIKTTVTEETLDILRQHGEDLTREFRVDHRFYFYTEMEMQGFLESVAENEKYQFISLQHSSVAMPVPGEDDAYLVKLEQDVHLHNDEILSTVAFLESEAEMFNGRYLGWQAQNTVLDEQRLN